MPQTYRAQVIIHTKDALAENYVTNTIAFIAASTIADFSDATDSIKAFYDQVASYFPIQIAQNGHEIKFYELPGPGAPNYPVAMTTFNLPSDPSGAGLPSEVALCLSFQGTKTPGFPQARRRGRIYIGPIVQSANSSGRPASGIRSDLCTAANDLAADLAAQTPSCVWAVWSTSDADAVEIENGWVDDAWDTQRRRGVQRTTRTTFEL